MACSRELSVSFWILLCVTAWNHYAQVILVLLGSAKHAGNGWIVHVAFQGASFLICRAHHLVIKIVHHGKLWRSLRLQGCVGLMCG